MTTANIKYTNIATAIAITSADGNTAGTWNSSALVDNQTNLYMDAIFGGSLQTGTVAAGGGTIDIYIAASWDGVEFSGGVDAGDVDITWGTTGSTQIGSESNLFVAGSITVNEADDDKDMVFGPISVASVCGGVMPLEWCVVIDNNSGGTLHATGTNNHLEYTGIEYTSA